MDSSFQTFQPVVGEPLPRSVRSEIHALLRQGFTIISTVLVGGRWHIRFRDGSRDLRLIVVREEFVDLGGDAA